MSGIQNPNTDPVQAMLAQASLTRTQFAPNSRYYGIDIATITQNGQPVAYLRRRFVPQPDQMQTAQLVTVVQGDRSDNLAAKYLGDPTMFWRLCDANGVDRAPDLTATPGVVLRITLPAGITGTTL
jgi:hypothetical protein